MNYKIVPYSLSFEKSVKKLIDDNFGVGFSVSKKMEEYYCWCAINESSELVGFASLKPLGGIALLDLIVVKKGFRGRGIGTSLFETKMKEAERLNLFQFVVNHWVRDGEEKPFCALDFGFELKESIPNYWGEDSLSLNYECLECKNIPCNCRCDVYILNLLSKR